MNGRNVQANGRVLVPSSERLLAGKIAALIALERTRWQISLAEQ
jgi:hypothetical protein